MIAVFDGYLIDSSYETKVVFMECCCSTKFRGQVVLDGYLIRAFPRLGMRPHSK